MRVKSATRIITSFEDASKAAEVTLALNKISSKYKVQTFTSGIRTNIISVSNIKPADKHFVNGWISGYLIAKYGE